jgi:alpha-glucosidase
MTASLSWVDIPDRPDVLAYRRGRVTCVTVFGEAPFTAPEDWGRPVLTSGPAGAGETAAWYVAD